MVTVPFDHDEFYPVYFFTNDGWHPDEIKMTNAEFVQFTMTHARWRRWQDTLAWRAGYYL